MVTTSRTTRIAAYSRPSRRLTVDMMTMKASQAAARCTCVCFLGAHRCVGNVQSSWVFAALHSRRPQIDKEAAAPKQQLRVCMPSTNAFVRWSGQTLPARMQPGSNGGDDTKGQPEAAARCTLSPSLMYTLPRYATTMPCVQHACGTGGTGGSGGGGARHAQRGVAGWLEARGMRAV